MANTKSAQKFIKVTAKKTSLNNSKKKEFRRAIKKVIEFVNAEKMDDARKQFVIAQKALDKAAKSGLIKKNTAARKKSRLARKLRKPEEK